MLIAPMPLLPIYKGIAGASLLAEILLQKYEYHMPYYRQIKQYSHLGMKGLTESTVLQAMKRPSRQTPTCSLLTAWCISAATS